MKQLNLSPATNFVQALQASPGLPAVFNPWRDIDPEHDLGAQSPVSRAEHLTQYLNERIGRARVVLCAEALGFRGGHFSGIAMTSERILLGHQAKRGTFADDVIEGGGFRTSQVTQKTPELGFTEPTATIVWRAMKESGIDTRDVVLWNAFAMHPMKGNDAWLTNRKPTTEELRIGRPLLEHFLSLFPNAKTVAIGKVAQEMLDRLGVSTQAQVRHPANGGASEFRSGVAKSLATTATNILPIRGGT